MPVATKAAVEPAIPLPLEPSVQTGVYVPLPAKREAPADAAAEVIAPPAVNAFPEAGLETIEPAVEIIPAIKTALVAVTAAPVSVVPLPTAVPPVAPAALRVRPEPETSQKTMPLVVEVPDHVTVIVVLPAVEGDKYQMSE